MVTVSGRSAAAPLGLLLLAACASQPPAAVATSVDVSTIEVSEGMSVPADAVLLGAIEGVSCGHSPLPTAATSAEAKAKLLQAAAAMGANGVSHFRTHTRGLTFSCVYSQVAQGYAYRTP